MANALYICYFGLRQPLVQTQVLPYLRELRKDDHAITLLTFEPELKSSWTADQVAAEKEKLKIEGINWLCLPYHKRPSAAATAYDVFRGAWLVRRLIDEKGIDILHGRVHVPTLMGALGRKISRRKPKLLFDIRGFFPEEYTDAGIWPADGLLYRSAKRVERWLMREAEGFVVLTEKARGILFGDAETSKNKISANQTLQIANRKSQIQNPKAKPRPVEVIPCCVDFESRFNIDRDALRREFREKLKIGDRTAFVHAGALGGLYLTEEIADFLRTARERDEGVFALFLTQSDPELIVSALRSRGFGEGDFFAGRVGPQEVPGYLCASDVGLSFVKAGYATQSRSPTKIPEYLACGLPIIANRGVGDVDALIEENGVGALVEEFTPAGYADALDKIASLGDVGAKCRKTAEKLFDLDTVGGRRYRRLYEKLMSDGEER